MSDNSSAVLFSLLGRLSPTQPRRARCIFSFFFPKPFKKIRFLLHPPMLRRVLEALSMSRDAHEKRPFLEMVFGGKCAAKNGKARRRGGTSENKEESRHVFHRRSLKKLQFFFLSVLLHKSEKGIKNEISGPKKGRREGGD